MGFTINHLKNPVSPNKITLTGRTGSAITNKHFDSYFTMLRKSLQIGATRGIRFASGGHGHGPSLPKVRLIIYFQEVKVGNKVHQLVEDHHHDHVLISYVFVQGVHKTALSNGTRVMTTVKQV